MSKNVSNLSFRKGILDNLFDQMGKAAQQSGTVEPADMEQIAEDYLIGDATVYGAVTFYDFLKPENKGKKVYVCNGTACLCAGSQDSLKNTIGEMFEDDEIGHMTCLGRCHENGAFHYNGKNYSAQSAAQIKAILSGKGVSQLKDDYCVGGNMRLLTAPEEGVSGFEKLLDKLLGLSAEEVLEEIKTSQIRGRGGAGFPMAFKLDSCRQTESELKFIVCNADEGDPGAYSDRYLLEQQPLAVLFGILAAGYVTGASWGVLYIRGEYPESVIRIEKAIGALRLAGLLGYSIKESGFNFDFKIIKAQGAYICGEETALLNSIEGQRPEVRTRPPYPTQEGLFGKPTVVNNVETLAALYHIIKEGSKSYAALGTQKSKGTKLISLDSSFNKPGIYEVEMGTSLRTVIEDMGGGFKLPIKAMQIGGPLGGIVPVEKIDALRVDFESFANEGFLLGHGSVVCIPESFPMIRFIEHLMDFAQYESCGKCFPCRLGTKRAHELLRKTIKEDSYKIERALFDDLLDTLLQGSLCGHGGGIPLPIKNALQYFADELKEHFTA